MASRGATLDTGVNADGTALYAASAHVASKILAAGRSFFGGAANALKTLIKKPAAVAPESSSKEPAGPKETAAAPTGHKKNVPSRNPKTAAPKSPNNPNKNAPSPNATFAATRSPNKKTFTKLLLRALSAPSPAFRRALKKSLTLVTAASLLTAHLAGATRALKDSAPANAEPTESPAPAIAQPVAPAAVGGPLPDSAPANPKLTDSPALAIAELVAPAAVGAPLPDSAPADPNQTGSPAPTTTQPDALTAAAPAAPGPAAAEPADAASTCAPAEFKAVACKREPFKYCGLLKRTNKYRAFPSRCHACQHGAASVVRLPSHDSPCPLPQQPAPGEQPPAAPAAVTPAAATMTCIPGQYTGVPCKKEAVQYCGLVPQTGEYATFTSKCAACQMFAVNIVQLRLPTSACPPPQTG